MSAIATTTRLSCDRVAASGVRCHVSYEHPGDEYVTRDAASAQGWSRPLGRLGEFRDICPTCTAEGHR
ncbi:hypothetical protein JOF56_011643 [Kibdelosporangium banguiense]|uniref:Uncharacterized protein n=1 Tax=Kibdelosporangium banguiense TaxID=1365924 RepID=A0ABS4U3L8_9PSEU|nr:hypothetical protein [Kibdelosporangium banguiense]